LPGDDFNVRAKWEDILAKHGWTYAGEYGEETRWCRPGKDFGISATTNHQGSDLLHVFTSSAPPFEPGSTYSKFSAYTLLNHGGDFKEAARDLREQGYGKKTMKAGKRMGGQHVVTTMLDLKQNTEGAENVE
jgi:putative DNA primase/helicase